MFLKMKFLKNKPLSVHLFNIEYNYNWFIEKLYIKIVHSIDPTIHKRFT